jgi:protein TonB
MLEGLVLPAYIDRSIALLAYKLGRFTKHADQHSGSNEHMAIRNPDITLYRASGSEFRAIAKQRPLPQPSWTSVVIITAVVAGITWAFVKEREPSIDARQVIAVNLASARLALEDGRYLMPPEHSAIHYYSTVLALDPTNADALRGKEVVTEMFIGKAKSAILDGRFADAAGAIESVRRIEPTHRRIGFLETELSKELEQHVLSIKVQSSIADAPTVSDGPNVREVRSPIERDTHAPLRNASVGATESELATLVQSVEPTKEHVGSAASAPSSKSLQDYELVQSAYERARSQVTAHVATTRTVQQEMQPEQMVVEAPRQPDSIEPKVIKLVEPEYPPSARDRGIEGWVDLTLLVAPTGDVLEARVENRTGSRSFERAALSAVRQWKYAPVARQSNEGVSVRVAFKLED